LQHHTKKFFFFISILCKFDLKKLKLSNMAKLPSTLTTLIAFLKKFPGVGSRTAERFAFHLLDWPEDQIAALSQQLSSLKEKITTCDICHCLKDEELCEFCNSQKRDTSILCIVSCAKDVYPIEETRIYKGLYHALGGLLSPMQGHHSDKINLAKIKERVLSLEIKDIILALDSTLEGDATALFLKEEMQDWGVRVSRLAFGLPLGSSLDYVDGGTLARAFLGRHNF
jgi:recombination protein RecR